MIIIIIFLFGCSDECLDEQADSPGSHVNYSELSFSYEEYCEVRDFCLDYSVQEDIIESAALDWEVSLMRSARFDCAEKARNIRIEVVNSDYPVLKELGIEVKGYNDGNIIYINEDRVCGSFLWNVVIRHELGHSLGLAHDSRYGISVMAEISSRGDSGLNIITKNVQEYMRVHNCKIGEPSTTLPKSEGL